MRHRLRRRDRRTRQPKAQLAAIRGRLHTTPNTITENLDRLEWFGLVIPESRDGLTYWHYADTAQVA